MRKALLLLAIAFGLNAQAENLLQNGDFSKLDPAGDMPLGWSREVHTKDGAVGSLRADSGALLIVNDSAKSAWVRSSQMRVPAQPEHIYRLGCRVRGDAHVVLIAYEFLKGGKPYITHNIGRCVPGEAWTTMAGTFRTGPDVRDFKVSLVTDRKGKAWFDDVELRDLSDPPAMVVPLKPAAAALAPFFQLDRKGKESAEPTRASICYDAEGLHVRFECAESQVAKMKTTQSANGMAVFADDCVEVFLCPGANGQIYYQVGINARGAMGFVRRVSYKRLYRNWHDMGKRPGPKKWEPKLPCTAKVDKGRWTVDITIPWKAIGAEPKPGMVMRANFTRRRNLGGEENASWALMQGKTFHDPSQWGRLILAAAADHPVGRLFEAKPAPPAPIIPDPADKAPAFAIRAFHTQAPLRADIDAYRELVKTLAKLKYNMLMIEVNDKLQYQRHPDIAHSDALSKPEMRELVQWCRGQGFDVVPQVQTWGHFNYVLRHEKYRHLAEEDKPYSHRGLWNYCPSNPDTYKLVFDLFDEVIEVFQPKYFHIGHDEITFTPIGVCPRCKGKTGGELFANDVNTLHDYLAKRGLKMMMWGDQLLKEHNGRPPYNTADALPKIPRDIVICDWHYAGWDDFPSVRFFKDHGFPVIACGWFNPTNVANFSRVALEAKAEGYCMTTWYGIRRLPLNARTSAAIALSAQFAWAPKRYTLDTLPYHPMQAFRQIHFPPHAAGPYRALDISAQANAPLKETDVAAAPRGVLSANGVPFVVRDKVVALTAKQPNAWQVPVGGKVQSLHFLHCTTRPAKVIDHLYDRYRVLPTTVGRYVVTYVDGSTEMLPLRYRGNITQWNSKLGAGECDLALQGNRLDGALVTLCAWEWTNPAPDKAIAAIDLCRSADQVDVIVLAITAR